MLLALAVIRTGACGSSGGLLSKGAVHVRRAGPGPAGLRAAVVGGGGGRVPAPVRGRGRAEAHQRQDPVLQRADLPGEHHAGERSSALFCGRHVAESLSVPHTNCQWQTEHVVQITSRPNSSSPLAAPLNGCSTRSPSLPLMLRVSSLLILGIASLQRDGLHK